MDSSVKIDAQQITDLLSMARNGIDFDFVAYLVLFGHLSQTHDDAQEFARRFRLSDDDGESLKSMDELLLTNAMLKHGVTVEQLIEFEATIEDLEFESERVANRNAYLAARNRGVSHEDVTRHRFYPAR
jgi:hypothetical protein